MGTAGVPIRSTSASVRTMPPSNVARTVRDYSGERREPEPGSGRAGEGNGADGRGAARRASGHTGSSGTGARLFPPTTRSATRKPNTLELVHASRAGSGIPHFHHLEPVRGILRGGLLARGEAAGQAVQRRLEQHGGHLARALLPRTKNGVHVVMQVTDRHLQLAYASYASSFSGLPGPVEVGWGTDLRHVTWIRNRNDVAGGDHEIGFADGSWCSVHFMGQGWRRMADAFPVRLSRFDPIPNPGQFRR